MSIFSFLKRRTESTPDLPVPQPHEAQPSAAPSAREVFQSPKLLVAWVTEHFLDGIPLENDYDLLPDAESRQRLEISPEQRDRCLREYSVLRLAGVSLFVKQNYEDRFWLVFTDHALVGLLRHVQTAPIQIDQAELRQALEQYVAAGAAGDPDEISTLYMRRVYDDNPNYIRMKVTGIGMLANDTLLSTYDVFRDAYCKVMHGLSYETLKALNSAVEKVERGPNPPQTP